MTILSRVGLAIIAIALGASAALNEVQANDRLEILSPPPEQIVYTNNQLKILFKSVDFTTLSAVDISVHAISDEFPPIKIASGDLRTFDGTGSASTIWDLQNVLPGGYTISIRVSADVVENVFVLVRKPPRVVGISGMIQKVEGSDYVIDLSAMVTSEAPIRRFLWFPDNEKKPIITEEPRLVYGFKISDAGNTVGLTVEDKDGGSGHVRYQVRYQVTGSPGPVVTKPAPANCACKRLTVNVSSVSSVYCLNPATQPALTPNCIRGSVLASAASPERLVWRSYVSDVKSGMPPCAPSTAPYSCKLGPNGIEPKYPNPNGRVGVGFEVVADLVPGSKPDQCAEGQLAAGTITVRNKAKKVGVVPAPNVAPFPKVGVKIVLTDTTETPVGPKYPAYFGKKSASGIPIIGASYGPDDYTKRSRVKSYIGVNKIRWLDVPSMATISPASPAPTDLNYIQDLRRFFAFVKGTPGPGRRDCWCEFTIQQQWTPGPPQVFSKYQRPGIPAAAARKKIVQFGSGIACSVK